MIVALLPALVIGGLPLGANARPSSHSTAWSLSTRALPVGKDKAIGLKLDRFRVIWVAGDADDPADNNRTFIYDTRSRTSREVARVPMAKPVNGFAAAGVLDDGSVVLAGGALQSAAGDDLSSVSVLSYRYDPRTDRWTRTGDLPEAQEWFFTPANRLRDGRLLIAGGRGLDGKATGAASHHAFVYNRRLTSSVKALDPLTGRPTGRTTVVTGKWDYTRTADGRESMLSGGHLFGNAVQLHDGRVFVGGGHSVWAVRAFGPIPGIDTDTSVLATDTQFFDPETGRWSAGAPLPTVPGEDDRISGSHGGRANGVCFAALPDNSVVIAGGASQVDGQSYFETIIGRQSILLMKPAKDPGKSTYQLSPHPIPSGTASGGIFGDGGRNQLLCYATSDHRVIIAGGQDTAGDDLYDTYRFDPRTSAVRRGPDLVHAVATWAAQFGFPVDYQTSAISTRAVGMRNSRLVFDGDVLVHGGAYDGVGSADFPGSRYIEQLCRA